MKTMTLKHAKMFWIMGLCFELLGILGMSSFRFAPMTFGIFGNIFRPVDIYQLWFYPAIDIIYVSLMLVAVKIISGITKEKKIFKYTLTIFVITLIWNLAKIPIMRLSIANQGILNSFHMMLFLIIAFAVTITTAVLLLRLLCRMSVLFGDSLFKLAGILQLLSVLMGAAVVTIIITFNTETIHILPTPPVNIMEIIDLIIGTSLTVLTYAWMIILIIAVFRMKYAPSAPSKEEGETAL